MRRDESQDEWCWAVEEAMERVVSVREAAELEAAHVKALVGRLDVLSSAPGAQARVGAPGDRGGGDGIGANDPGV